uniref:Reticulocalbin 2 n=1 Tax=Anser brachyrhynchus TaxID=132585 RepID=A0A8B9BD82_9AVES
MLTALGTFRCRGTKGRLGGRGRTKLRGPGPTTCPTPPPAPPLPGPAAGRPPPGPAPSRGQAAPRSPPRPLPFLSRSLPFPRPSPRVPSSAGAMRRRPLLALGLALWALGAAHGQHRADYDREALLGGQLHLKEKKRFEKANRDDVPDLNVDEFIAFEHPEEVEYMTDFVIQEALEEHDKDGDGFVNLEEFLGDYRRDPTAREDPEWILVEKDRFVNDYDKDNDGKLSPQELLSWIVPNNQGIAQEEALHLIEEMDLNDDKKLSEAEVLKNQDLFLNSEATDYGRQLHDERFYHEEL